jgi:hypothetical protein
MANSGGDERPGDSHIIEDARAAALPTGGEWLTTGSQLPPVSSAGIGVG